MSLQTLRHTLRRTALAAAVFTVLALTFLASAPQPANAIQQGLCTYWSDASRTEEVGQRGYDCCGNPVNWGVTSAYYECVREWCIWCPPPAE
jgi:hypothetical protein